MDILGSKTAIKILRVVFEEPVREFKEIELINTAETGKGSGAAVIDALVDEKILLEKRQGRTKLLLLNLKSNRSFALKHFFNQSKVNNINGSKRSALFFFKKEAFENVHLIILFGSTFAGTAKEDSDIDVLIVAKDTQKIESARKKTEELFGEQFNLHYSSHEEIMQQVKEDMFVRNIILKGYVLVGYDFCHEIFSSIGGETSIEQLLFLQTRINASLRNYIKKDSETAKEILDNTIQQLIFYILEEKNIPCASRKDAEKLVSATEEGKQIEKIKKAPLKDRISQTNDLVMNILSQKILEEEGYGYK